MSTVSAGDRWSVGICDDMIVWEFASEVGLSAVTDRDSSVFRRLVGSCDGSAIVTVLDFDEVIETAAIDGWERASRIAAEMGIDRWAIVADETNAAVLERSLDTARLDTWTTDDRSAAIEWARSA